MIMSIKTYLIAAAVLLLAVGAFSFAAHERAVEKQQIEAAQREAEKVADAKANEKLQNALRKASDAQGKLDQYVRDYPLGNIVCYQNRYVLPKPTDTAGLKNPSPRPDSSRQVPGGGPESPVEVDAALGLILSSFGEMAVSLAEFQNIAH
jgi:hypothetical protein